MLPLQDNKIAYPSLSNQLTESACVLGMKLIHETVPSTLTGVCLSLAFVRPHSRGAVSIVLSLLRPHSRPTRAVSIPLSPPSALSLSFSLFRPRSLSHSPSLLSALAISLSSPSVLSSFPSLSLSFVPPLLLVSSAPARRTWGRSLAPSLSFFSLLS